MGGVDWRSNSVDWLVNGSLPERLTTSVLACRIDIDPQTAPQRGGQVAARQTALRFSDERGARPISANPIAESPIAESPIAAWTASHLHIALGCGTVFPNAVVQ